jgi:hypothetical protein
MTNDEEFLPKGTELRNEIYLNKLNKLSTVISQIGTERPDGPALLVAEGGNDTVLNDR